ncbi:MAG: purine-binding chemotaxis protein CheW [Spartobacteria bacterium]|nr:purine-binding chemotaxis protein CheW [Spartobacteria bacterium]
MAGNDDLLNNAGYDDESEDSMKDRYLTFRVGKEVYGINIYHVIEIVSVHKITVVPDMPEFVKGVINLRGQVIPIIDVRLRFSMEPRAYDERTCIVVVKVKDINIGMVVDTVNEVLDIPPEQISPPPRSSSQSGGGRYIQGMGKIGDQVKILLDVEKLLFEEELALLSGVSA